MANITIDDLGEMMKEGFDEQDNKYNELDEKLNKTLFHHLA